MSLLNIGMFSLSLMMDQNIDEFLRDLVLTDNTSTKAVRESIAKYNEALPQAIATLNIWIVSMMDVPGKIVPIFAGRQDQQCGCSQPQKTTAIPQHFSASVKLSYLYHITKDNHCQASSLARISKQKST